MSIKIEMEPERISLSPRVKAGVKGLRLKFEKGADRIYIYLTEDQVTELAEGLVKARYIWHIGKTPRPPSEGG